MNTEGTVAFTDIIETYGHTAPYRVIPERCLWLSVMALAMEDCAHEDHEDWFDLEEWILSDHFKFICKALGVQSGAAARHIKDLYCG